MVYGVVVLRALSAYAKTGKRMDDPTPLRLSSIRGPVGLVACKTVELSRTRLWVSPLQETGAREDGCILGLWGVPGTGRQAGVLGFMQEGIREGAVAKWKQVC